VSPEYALLGQAWRTFDPRSFSTNATGVEMLCATRREV
jgi:hypothetical protein